jgi:hypothetical protein
VSGRPALHSAASPLRLLVIDGAAEHDVFEVLEVAGEIAGDVVRVRSALLFDLGEELHVRLVRAGSVREATARVRAHTGPSDARVTELEISERGAPRGAAG